MTRYERKLFFERLVTLREAYRAETHVPIEMSIEDAMTFAADTYSAAVAADAARRVASSSASTKTGPSTAA